ncbi:hypothetical protein A3Q56_07682 [Intoshia linei]|uniref:Uncharacterized protein n=1 Tax=Intoshia linei TaxID=1819745 RepID=A0A177AT92_9BILA|nr:hypothetical protein A3Q56_07682 [Intoshia linei]
MTHRDRSKNTVYRGVDQSNKTVSLGRILHFIRVVYFTALFPYVVLLILLIRGLTLEGHEDGIYFYIRNVNWDKLKDITVWKEAASQIFFSLSTSWGGLIALSSYNKFHNNIMRDAILIPILNCATSLFAGFVIFSFLGYLAHMTNTSVDKVVDHGPGLAFIAYPYAVSTMPLPQIWAVLFFVMLITLGMDSQFTLIETIATSVMDSSPKMRNYKTILFAVLCSILFLPGLIMCTNGGSYVLTLMDTYIGSWNLLLLAIFECICIGYVYGTENFSKDLVCILSADINLCSTDQKCLNVGDTVEGNIENYEIFEKEEIKKDAEKMNLKMQNIGDDVKNNIISNEKHCSSIKCVKVRQNNSNSYSLKFWKITSIWWIVCWKIITPLGITFVMIFSWIKYNRTKDGDYIFPLYAEAIGWSMTIFIVLCGFVTSVIILFTRKGPFRIKLQKSLKPSVNYKPDLPKHQLLAKHLPFYSREFICLENNVVI